MVNNSDYKNSGLDKYDLAIFDPPFDLWEDIDWIPEASTYMCFTNFQNRHHVQNIFGNPKFEIIWHFKDGRWVSHKMPRHTHEHILIYGELKYDAYTGEYNTDRKPQKKGRGSIGRDKNLGDRTYIPKERKLLNSVIEHPRNVSKKLGVWGKPEGLAMPILEWLVSKGDSVWDGFAGSGTFGVCCKKLGVDYMGYDINPDSVEYANNRIDKLSYNLFSENL